jgi:hypothetical protein
MDETFNVVFSVMLGSGSLNIRNEDWWDTRLDTSWISELCIHGLNTLGINWP